MKLKAPSTTQLVNSWNSNVLFECFYFSHCDKFSDHDFSIVGTNYIVNFRQPIGKKPFYISEKTISDYIFICTPFRTRITLFIHTIEESVQLKPSLP